MAEIRGVRQEWLAIIAKKHLTFQLLLVVGCVDPGPVGFEGPDEADLNRTAAMEASGEPWAEVAASEIPGFAGFYLDEDGSLVASASIARSANAARQYVANWQRENGYDGLPIRFREVEYDFLELSRWKAQLSRPAIEAGATMVDADEVANRVVIGLPPGASEDPLLHILSSFDIPRKAVQMIQFGSMQLLDDIVPTTLRDTVRPLIGGLENGPDGCTIGFITEYEGEPAFVTASHCSNLPDQSDATLFRQPLWGPRVGQETSDQSLALSIDYPSTGTTCSYPGCRGSDTQITDIFDTVQAALGRVARTTWVSTTQDTGSITLSNPPYQHVVQKRYRNQIISGTTIDKVGRTTGWTRGHLRRSCISIDQFRCMYTGSMYVDRGDSGSRRYSAFSTGSNTTMAQASRCVSPQDAHRR